MSSEQNRPLGLVVIIVLSGGCAERGQVEATVDTLATGVIVVTNSGNGAWTDQTRWQLVHEVTIGSRAGPGPGAFGLVADFEIDDGGRVYVLDLFPQEIRVFTPQGEHIRTMGGEGGGPGELRGANGMTFDPAGRLWVMNQGNVRYSVFDTSGTLLQEPRRPTASNQGSWSGMFSPAGELYDHVSGGSTSVRYDTTTGQFVDSIHYPALPAGTPFGWGHRLRTHDGWWLAVASEYRLHKATPEGDTVLVVERPHDRIEFSGGEGDSLAPPWVDVPEGARVRMVGDPAEPRYRRVFQRFFVDEADNLWVMLPHAPDLTETTFDVFDPEGRFLGAVTVPYRVERRPSPVIRGNRIVFLTKDELEVPYVTMMRIVKETARSDR